MPTNPLDKPFITPRQLQQTLLPDVSLATIYRRARLGELESVHIGKRVLLPTGPLKTKLGLCPASETRQEASAAA